MKFILCLIYDKVAGMYSSPLIYDNIECAKRHFGQLIKNQPNLNGDDYELYVLGNYNPKTGLTWDDENSIGAKSLSEFERGLMDEEEE